MISYLIAHAEIIGWFGLGFIAGVFFAAWRQLRAERIADDEWVAAMRSRWE